MMGVGLGGEEQKGREPPEGVNLEFLQCNPIAKKDIEDTVWEDIKANHDNFRLDFNALVRLTRKIELNAGKKRKGNGLRKKIKRGSKGRKKIDFLSELASMDCEAATRLKGMFISLKLSPEELRDMILTMEVQNKNAADMVTRLCGMVPLGIYDGHKLTGGSLKEFTTYIQSNNLEGEVPRFGVSERFWWYCSKIPRVHQRVNLWKLQVEFEDASNNLRLMAETLNKCSQHIGQSQEMRTVFSIVLAISNFLNFRASRRLRQARGVHISIFEQLRSRKVNEPPVGGTAADPLWSTIGADYNLLTYLVHQVEQEYPRVPRLDRRAQAP